MDLYSLVAGLPLEVSHYSLEPLEHSTPVGWTRVSTVVRLEGAGHAGVGEDVTYSAEDQRVFQATGTALPLSGQYTLDSFCRHLDRVELFPSPTETPSHNLYRRWAFESAALDLALRQDHRSLGEVLGRVPGPVSYVMSLGLGEPASCDPLRSVLELYPEMRFKVDYSASWTAATVAALAELGRVDVVDLKGQYRGAFEGPPGSASQYQMVAEGLPGVWIEDPEWTEETAAVLRPHRERVTWDAILHSVADIVKLPVPPRSVNIKPSRFGFLRELFRTYEYCAARNIAMYGGGQFELGPGRKQIQCLAGLFHAAAANDVAPREFNAPELLPGLPISPLQPSPTVPGFAPQF